MRAFLVVVSMCVIGGCGGGSDSASSSEANAAAAAAKAPKPLAACIHFATGGSASLKFASPGTLVWTFDGVSDPPNKEQRTTIVSATKTAPDAADAYHLEVASGQDFEVRLSLSASRMPGMFAGAAGDDCSEGFSADRKQLDALVAALAAPPRNIGSCALDSADATSPAQQPFAITLKNGLEPGTAILSGSSPDGDTDLIYVARGFSQSGNTRTIAGEGAAVFAAAGRHEDPFKKFVVHINGSTSQVETGSTIMDPSLTKCTVDWQKVADALKTGQ